MPILLAGAIVASAVCVYCLFDVFCRWEEEPDLRAWTDGHNHSSDGPIAHKRLVSMAGGRPTARYAREMRGPRLETSGACDRQEPRHFPRAA